MLGHGQNVNQARIAILEGVVEHDLKRQHAQHVGGGPREEATVQGRRLRYGQHCRHSRLFQVFIFVYKHLSELGRCVRLMSDIRMSSLFNPAIFLTYGRHMRSYVWSYARQLVLLYTALYKNLI